MHRIIQQFSPKNRLKKIRLRHADGSPASPVEALQLAVDFAKKLWAGPPAVIMPTCGPPGVPFSVQELQIELAAIPHNKSVAGPFIPGMVIKALAPHIASTLFSMLQVWWNLPTPYIPPLWKRGWIVTLPKPNSAMYHGAC